MIENLIDLAFFNDFSGIHDHDTIGNLRHHSHVMCDHDDTHIHFFFQIID
ncbi:hypothetical protein KBTX_04516 [wastewater metagenome]|uniref:Uncharacterized protein n=2 Tax=unclassified sequences TaxID=12908 RepID=A0A5B8RGE8_9ZZZZ|nr:hypothetical protein KBTEX_04516 [uncultured organism]